MRKVAMAVAAALAVLTLFASTQMNVPGRAVEPSPGLYEAAPEREARPDVNPNKVVVRYRDGVPEVAGLVRSAAAGGAVDVQARSGLHVIDVPEGGDADDLVASLRSDPLVAEAGVSRVAQAFDAPDDTNYSYQWHMHNTVGGMHAEAAWPLAPEAGDDVVVAVIDSGVAYEDYDGSLGGVFDQHFVQAPDLATTAFVDPWDFIFDEVHANDDNGHGSHVTGTIAQNTNNSYGVAGVAYNATIMPLKVLDYSGFGEDAHLVEAVYYAVDHDAQVINISAGFPETGTPNGSGVYCTEIVGLNAALDYAAANGVVVVAAAGNESAETVSCPAAYPSVISVAGSRFDGQIAPYSNGGATLDVTAPGGDPNEDQNDDGFSDGAVQETYCYDWLSLLFMGTYDEYCNIFMSGTSMATPHVTGLAALLLGEDPTLTAAEVRSYIETTARDRGATGWDAVYGWGVIDAEAALQALGGITPEPTDTPTATPTATPCPDFDGDTVCDAADLDDDSDGCPDTREAVTGAGAENSGGNRNSLNPYDYFNPTDDGVNRVDDILSVVGQYFDDDADGNPGLPPYEPGYDPDTDRTDDPGSSEGWDLLIGNGQQRIDDILAMIKQYFHDCS